MTEGDKMRYSDIIQPDDSIEKLIRQLGELSKQYETTIGAVRAGADRIVQALKATSGATSEGRRSIEEAAASTSRLERAQNELKLALSDTGKQIAWLKAQTTDANKASVEQQRYIKQAVSSYDRLKSDLKEMVGVYKSLTAAERADSQMGQQLLANIVDLTKQVRALDAAMKPHVQTLSAVEKAEQKLAYLQTEEGQRLLQLKARIAEVTGARKQQKASVDPLVAAQEKLAYAYSYENQQLKLYSTQISEANRIAKLQMQIANSAEGSYNRLAAQYELNKIKLNQMSGAQRQAADAGKKLEAETMAIYLQMQKLQEATGNYRLSVGHYQKAWDGLGMSVSQVVRELPAAAVSLNTFFLGISNNIPMVVDEINRLRLQNKAFQAEGKPTVNITKSIVKSLFSWNTALVLGLTALAMFGEKMVEYAKKLRAARGETMSTAEAIKNVNAELKSTNDNYGANIVTLKKLQGEWSRLSSTMEKTDWIEANASAFEELGININDVNDADAAFILQTDSVIRALQLRARATAASKLAEEKYTEALRLQAEAEAERETGVTAADKWQHAIATMHAASGTPGAQGLGITTSQATAEQESAEAIWELRVSTLEKQSEAAEKVADGYFKLQMGYTQQANDVLAAADLLGGNRDKGKGGGATERERDLTDRIYRTRLAVQKKFEQSQTELETDEYEKRKKAAEDAAEAKKRELLETNRQLLDYLNDTENKYKDLTADEKAMVEASLQEIQSTITNIDAALQQELLAIQAEADMAALEQLQSKAKAEFEAAQHTQVEITMFTLNQEKARWQKQIELAEAGGLRWTATQIAAANAAVKGIDYELAQLAIDEQASELEILNETISLRLEAVKKGSYEEYQLKLQALENERKLAILANQKLPESERQSEADINAAYGSKATSLAVGYVQSDFEQQQELEEAKFNAIQHSEKQITRFKLQQEKERWEQQIWLAESGMLEWSQVQIDAAKETVNGIDRELEKVEGFKGFMSSWGKNGLGGSLLEMMGFDDDAISAFGSAVDMVIGYLQEIADAEVQLAEKAVEAAEKRVDAAQSAYDAEVEARNNGYASNVATAKKELEQEKKKQQEKQKLLEQAQKRQEALNTVMQAVSLVTASANLWSSFSSVPIVGPILAATAIAAMWASFAVAKVKAKQVTSSEAYGEGGLEFLEGGSHASGNDIDLGTQNKKGKRMRAEGGEALAIINKKRTRKYRKILPDIIDSLNKGTFEDKYLNAFGGSNGLNISLNPGGGVDLSKIEEDVQSIKKQNESRYYALPNGNTVIIRKNVKRVIKN